MAEEQSKERAKKILEIALNMRQAKELRIEAVRLLKVMGAIDELWSVVQTVRCPFTKQAAIDSIPALEVRIQDDPEDSQPSSSVTTVAAEEKVQEVKVSDEPSRISVTDLERSVLSYLYALLTRDGVEAVSLPVISGKTKIEPQVTLKALTNLSYLKFVKSMHEDKGGFTRELFGITNQGIKYAELQGLSA